ncbi:Outer dense fiber protein 3-like protein 2 [Eumeta japonica]|uniref:Outer dense fiber protein 3-like protein 2 n=1 Tax=Eumeta variegata TaxID=151549 RepID=A0A4C1WWQ1_EUMVA|nr:Outer dense fiber protein 3-like protein 2 [Eumeta japonica]
MNDYLKKRGMKVNVGKTKVMELESLFINDGKYDRDIERRVNAGNKMNGALLAIMNSKSVSRRARLATHNGVLIPTLMYSSECWVWQKKNESRINAVEMRSLRSRYGVSRKDRCRNSDVTERCGLKEHVVTRVERECEIYASLPRAGISSEHSAGVRAVYPLGQRPLQLVVQLAGAAEAGLEEAPLRPAQPAQEGVQPHAARQKQYIMLDSEPIQYTQEAHSLELTIDPNLRFETYVREIVRTGFYRLKVLYRMRSYLNANPRVSTHGRAGRGARRAPALTTRVSGPGPAAYQLPSTVGFDRHDPSRPRNPSYSLYGRRTRQGPGAASPGPVYNLSYLTRRGVCRTPSWTLAGRFPARGVDATPGPATYRPECCPTKEYLRPCYSLYRRLDGYRPRRPGPGPAGYSLKFGPSMPAFSFGARLAGYQMSSSSPGPATYYPKNPNFQKYSTPEFSLQARGGPQRKVDRTPGPAAYGPALYDGTPVSARAEVSHVLLRRAARGKRAAAAGARRPQQHVTPRRAALCGYTV